MNMFKGTGAKTVEEYLENIAEPRRSEVAKLHEMIKKAIPDQPVRMWDSFIGYGSYHYKTKSGREGDWPPVALASQKNYISIYICAAKNGKYVAEGYVDKLPKASIGRSCIRIKKLDDVDIQQLLAVVREGVAMVKESGQLFM